MKIFWKIDDQMVNLVIKHKKKQKTVYCFPKKHLKVESFSIEDEIKGLMSSFNKEQKFFLEKKERETLQKIIK